MSAIPTLNDLVGKWKGTNRLWLMPGEAVRESETPAEIALIARGQFSEMRYAWAANGRSQGQMFLAVEAIYLRKN